METEKIAEFAPYIVIILMYFVQNKIFARPADLEKKHREIIKEMKEDFVELNAYKEFQNHVLREFEAIKQDMNKGFNELKEIIRSRRGK